MDSRFLVEAGREVFTGNELLVKGALETENGVHLYTGYPGSPVAGFFDCLADISDLLQKKGIRAFQANNEALGVAAVNGSQMAACRAMVAFKSVGTHVAADALALGNLAGAHPQGGVVVVSGEDPWCDSTQVPADSRFLFEHLRMPVVEPGSNQELKDWVGLSFKLSQAGGLYIGYIVTVAGADGGGSVEVRPNYFPEINTGNKVALETRTLPLDKVLLPPRSWKREIEIGERYEKTIKAARALGINRIYAGEGNLAAEAARPSGRAAIGFITTGMAKPYLEHVLHDVGMAGAFPILNMGMSFPIDTQIVEEFSQLCERIIVIEERRSFLEKNIRDSIFHELAHEKATEIAGKLYGKKFPGGGDGIPDVRGLNYSILAQRVIPLIQSLQKPTDSNPWALEEQLNSEMSRLRTASKPRLRVFDEKVVSRTPTFCPGCPHRDSSSVLLQIRKDLADPEYMRTTHNQEAVDLVAHGDTGCYTMLMFAPTEQLMHNYSGMGLGGGTGSGIDPFITNKQIVFMGDGTFFHSGQVAISNAIKAGQDLTFIILENGTTAMTGHQEHAGTEIDLLGNHSYIQDIYSIVSGMKGSSPLTVAKINPAERTNYRKTLEETILRDGVKVIIADKECGITYHRRKFKEEKKTIKEHGYLPRKVHMNVTPEVCENCLECTKQTACPGLTSVDTDYGKKIDTDLTWCVNDGACERVRASNEYGHDIKPCPSFEQITVVRKKRRRYTLPHMALDKLPEPTYVAKLDKPGDEWRCHLAGVGGMGVGLVGALLVRAGHKQGYHVLFMDKKGLAIRNGGVYAQLTFVKSDVNNDHNPDDVPKITASIPYGKADLLLGVDVLEAARAIDPREQFRVASSERTAAVLNLHKQNTVFALLGKDDFDPDALRQEIYESCREDLSFAKNLSEICEQRLGSKQFVNIMILGVAYQLGLIPVSHHAIAWAIKDSIRRDHRRNLKAFNIGRKLALEPRALPMKPQPITWDQLLTNKSRILRKSKFFGRHHADRFEQLVQTNVKLMRDLPEQGKYDLALRIYDLIQYQDEAYTRRYLDLIRSIYKRDSRQQNYRATVAAIWGLAKVMLIKDEPYVAYLLTRTEKKQRDNAKYNIDTSNGDRIIYRHHTKPDLGIGKWRFRLNITTTDWQLKLVRHMKWWRKIPGWHTKEAQLRDWYMGLVGRVGLNTPEAYERSVQWLCDVNNVTGYREVRYPKQDRYIAAIEAEMTAPATGSLLPVREFETAGVAK